MGNLHSDALVIDGLEIAAWNRDVFEAMHAAGITAVNCTCCVWEGFSDTMKNVAEFKGWLRENDDILRPVRSVADIDAAKQENRVGIMLGWQNISGIEDHIPYLELFKELGVGVIQMAYNTQNLAATGCYERNDAGLSEFGHDVLSEMNRLGILADLSHVGRNTTRDVVAASKQPVVISHSCPAAMREHPRNKTDDEMRAVAETGGLVGLTLFPWFMAAGDKATLDDYIDVIEHTLNVVGEDHVAIGTDFTDGQDARFFEWLLRDKGYGRPLVDLDVAATLNEHMTPAGITGIRDFPAITAAMEKRGWSEERTLKILGKNWYRVLGEVWEG
jgi:membrane dipeptidase